MGSFRETDPVNGRWFFQGRPKSFLTVYLQNNPNQMEEFIVYYDLIVSCERSIWIRKKARPLF